MHNLFDRLSIFSSLKEQGIGIPALTAYDYPMGRLLDESGVPFILVGDSLGMVVLGYPDTTSVTLENMVYHTGAVSRGVTNAVVGADLPYQSYETPAQALSSAQALVAAGAHAVKLEGGRVVLPQIKEIIGAQIPVIGHLGILPQQVKEEGGYRKKGRTEDEARGLIEDALALEEAGVSGIVLEGIIPEVAEEITKKIDPPTLGIASGQYCDGQILVTYDLVGFFPWFTPSFVKPSIDVAGEVRGAVKEFVQKVRLLGS